MATDLVLFGPPGAGKGTQGASLAQALHVIHLSTGNLLREAVRSGTELGRQVKQRLDAGQLVEDEVVNALVAERLASPSCAPGVVLDGYPRNLTQAGSLDQSLATLSRQLRAALLIEVPEGEVVKRLGGRRSCSGCSTPYHLDTKPPRVTGVCDTCGKALVTRVDDEPQVVRGRLEVYRHETEPLVRYYEDRSLLRRVDGLGSLDEVGERLEHAVGYQR